MVTEPYLNTCIDVRRECIYHRANLECCGAPPRRPSYLLLYPPGLGSRPYVSPPSIQWGIMADVGVSYNVLAY